MRFQFRWKWFTLFNVFFFLFRKNLLSLNFKSKITSETDTAFMNTNEKERNSIKNCLLRNKNFSSNVSAILLNYVFTFLRFHFFVNISSIEASYIWNCQIKVDFLLERFFCKESKTNYYPKKQRHFLAFSRIKHFLKMFSDSFFLDWLEFCKRPKQIKVLS